MSVDAPSSYEEIETEYERNRVKVDLYSHGEVEDGIKEWLDEVFEDRYTEKYSSEKFTSEEGVPVLSIAIPGELGTTQLMEDEISINRILEVLES